MRAVLLVLVAVHFEDVGVGHQIVRDFDRKGFRVHPGVVEGHFHVHVSEVAAVETLCDAQRFAMGVPHCIDQGLFVEACSFHYQDVAIPMPGRVAQIGRELKLFGQYAAVGEDLSMQIVDFIKENRLSWRLNNLNRFGEETGEGKAKERRAGILNVAADRYFYRAP